VAVASTPRSRFPGDALVAEGLASLAAGQVTVPSLLVSIASRRLRALGEQVSEPLSDPERRLHHLLERELGPAAHSRYNAFVRQVVSYCAAREQDARRLER
jgi:hypothetical protein